MRDGTRNRRTWLLVSIGAVLVIALAIILSASRPDPYSDYLSTSPSPTGVKGFYSYLKQGDTEVSRWRSSPDQLPEFENKQMLLMVGPYYTLTQAEMDQYVEWMEKGHTLWLFKSNPAGFFNTKVEYVEPNQEATIVTGLDFGQANKAMAPNDTRVLPTGSDEVLLEDSKGVLAYKRTYGEGELIVSANPDWITNGTIMDHDHLNILLHMFNQTGAESILIDEYIHGEENIPTVFSLYPKWLLVLAMQAILLTILWLWMKGKRFGPIFLPRKAKVRYGDERLKALASWYMRGELYKESLSIQEEYVRFLLQERWGISMSLSWHEIQSFVENRLSTEQQEKWKRWTHELDLVVSQKRVNKREYLEWSKKLNDMRKEVQDH